MRFPAFRFWTQGSRITLLAGSRLWLPDERREIVLTNWVDVGVEEKNRRYRYWVFPYGEGLVPMVVSIQQDTATSKDHSPLPVGSAAVVLSPFLAHRAPRGF